MTYYPKPYKMKRNLFMSRTAKQPPSPAKTAAHAAALLLAIARKQAGIPRRRWKS
jgi:hypothetical protein